MTKGLNVPGFQLPWEAVDSIVLAALKEQREHLRTELYNHKVNGAWMHPEDVLRNRELIEHLTAIIDYYGG